MDWETVKSELAMGAESTRRRTLETLPPLEQLEQLRDVAACLGDPSPAVCEAAVDALVRADSEAAAEAAAEHLRADEAGERCYAMDALVRLASRAVPVLIRRLGDPHRDVRKFAVDGLAAIACPSSLPALVSALEDTDANVAAAAAEALGAFRAPQAMHALTGVLERGPDWLRIAALASLGTIGGHNALKAICGTPRTSTSPVLAAAVDAVDRASSADQRLAACFLAGLLTHPEAELRRRALVALGHVPDGISALQGGPCELVRAVALREIDSPRAEVREAALVCLTASPDRDADAIAHQIAPLLEDDPSPGVRVVALQALATLGALGPAQLTAVASDTDQAAQVRSAALRILADRDLGADGATMESCFHMVGDARDPELQAAALRVLVRQGHPAAPGLALSLLVEDQPWDDTPLMRELSIWPVEDLVPLGCGCLAQRDNPARGQLFTALFPVERSPDLCATAAGRTLLAAAIADGDWHVRAHALRLIQESRADWARESIRERCQDPDARVRVRAVEALGRFDLDQREEDLLRARTADESGWVRAAALEALLRSGRLGEETVLAALADSFPPVRRAALAGALHLLDVPSHRVPPSHRLRRAVQRAAEEAAQAEDKDLAQIGTELSRRLAECWS